MRMMRKATSAELVDKGAKSRVQKLWCYPKMLQRLFNMKLHVTARGNKLASGTVTAKKMTRPDSF